MDPNILTAEKLKKELIERHVTLPKNPRKEVLVELYRVHVPAGKAAGHRLEFSDDDERVVNAKSRKSLSAVSKRRSMTTRTKDEVIISSSGINVSDMSDVELMETLLKHGADVGPVTDTTRTVYEKKLVKLLDNPPRTTVLHVNPIKKKKDFEEPPARQLIQYSDEEEDVEEDEEEEKEEEEEEEEYRKSNVRQNHQPLQDENKDYEDSYTVRSRYTASNESYGYPNARESMEFAARPPLSYYRTSEEISRQPLSSSGHTSTSTSRRSHVYTSSEYLSQPRSTPLVRDSLLSGGTGLSKSGSRATWQAVVPKEKGKRRGKCFWLFIFFVLLIIVVLTVVIWNMDPAFSSIALPSGFGVNN